MIILFCKVKKLMNITQILLKQIVSTMKVIPLAILLWTNQIFLISSLITKIWKMSKPPWPQLKHIQLLIQMRAFPIKAPSKNKNKNKKTKIKHSSRTSRGLLKIICWRCSAKNPTPPWKELLSNIAREKRTSTKRDWKNFSGEMHGKAKRIIARSSGNSA